MRHSLWPESGLRPGVWRNSNSSSPTCLHIMGWLFIFISHQDPKPDQPPAGDPPEVHRDARCAGYGGCRGSPAKHSVHQTFRLRPCRPPGQLDLLRPARSGVNMAIDISFRHLAESQDGKAVGIVLSGMGSDGTLGIRALEEHMGMAMAQ